MSGSLEDGGRVVIVGGGPVGMVAALALARHGIPSLVVEQGSDEVRSEWRGSTLHPPTMEFLDELGLADAVLAGAVRASRLEYRDLELDDRVAFPYELLTELTRFPFRLQFEQYKLVRLLRQAIREAPQVETLFEHRMVDLTQDEQGVEVAVEGPDGPVRLRSQWLVAADGAHSRVRKILDVGFPGFTYPHQSVVVAMPFRFEDYVEDLDAVCYWSGPRGRFSLIRTPDVWRAAVSTSTAVDDDYDNAAGPHPDFLAGMELLLPDSVDVGAVELQQHQMYRSHQRLADSFRYGRVLLAGDAAHLSSTTGGMGLNSGIHDAVALAGALAGPDPDRAASEYSERRRLMAERFVQPATTLNRNAGDRLAIDARKERLAELRKIAEDERSAREYLRNASMIGAQH